MSIDNSKTQEIKRLTTPLTIHELKAYDSNGNILKCVETLSDVRYMLEPEESILSDDEVLKYASHSKAASKIRLKRGFGNVHDILLIHDSLPPILGIYYVILICITFTAFYDKNTSLMICLIILMCIPLLYLYYIFNLKRYEPKTPKKNVDKVESSQKPTQAQNISNEAFEIQSLKKYEKETNDLKVVFDVKEEVVRDLIKKRFEPPQITYDRFISAVDSCHKLFYIQVDAVENITKWAGEDSPRVEKELDNKINTMKKIIDQIEGLTNELVINLSSKESSDEDVKSILGDVENLIDDVKEY